MNWNVTFCVIPRFPGLSLLVLSFVSNVDKDTFLCHFSGDADTHCD